MPGASSSGCSPQPSAPTTASCSSPPSCLCASMSTCKFFRGSRVATVRTYGAPRSAAGPSAWKTSFGAGCATRIRSLGTPSVAVTSRPVYAEFTKTTSQVVAAFPYLRAVHRPRSGGRPLGMVKRHEVVDRRRTHARALGRVHPIREVKDVELAEQSLRHRVARAHSMPCAPRGRRAAATCAPRRRPRRAQRESGSGL